MTKLRDEIFKRYGRLTVTARGEPTKAGQARWVCTCDCGGTALVTGQNLRSGMTRSCGCVRVETTGERARSHGMSKHPAMESYKGAKGRCNCKTDRDYPFYGGRGIQFKLPPFEEFWSVMGDTWFQGATLERKNNSGHYEMANIEWATRRTQCLNTRRARRLTLNGVTMNLCDWAAKLEISPSSLQERLQKWPLERALTERKNPAK